MSDNLNVKELEEPGRVLLIDDNPDNLHVLKAILESHGYKAFGAISGKLALSTIDKVQPDVILLDVVMPELDGYEVCEQLKAQDSTKDIPVLFISALHEPLDVMKAYESGAVDYIAKPFQPNEVLARVKTHVSLYHMHVRLENIVKKRVDELMQVKNKYSQLENCLEKVIRSIALSVEALEPMAEEHLQKVADLSVNIANKLGLDESVVEGVRLGAILHDIGKLHISTDILNRREKLTGAEFETLKTHPTIGYEMLKAIDFPWPVAEMVYQHHELLDGSGFPRGLKGDEILLEGHIICVANMIDEKLSPRSYREPCSVNEVLERLQSNKGILYNPDVVDACVSMLQEM